MCASPNIYECYAKLRCDSSLRAATPSNVAMCGERKAISAPAHLDEEAGCAVEQIYQTMPYPSLQESLVCDARLGFVLEIAGVIGFLPNSLGNRCTVGSGSPDRIAART